MERVYQESFSEVAEILKIMPIDLLCKIPAQFRQIIIENKADNYTIDIKEPLEEDKLKKETVVILGLIYRDFLASPEEREELQLKDSEELKRIEEEMKNQYGVDNISKKRKPSKNQDVSTDLTLYKEPGFFKKLLNVIKGIFKKNKF